MFQYSLNLAWSDEDEGYIATVPELPGLSAFGVTPEEAVHEAQVAADLVIQVMEEDGEQIPQPKKLVEYSGQLRLRLPKSLHKKLAVEADREHVSLNTLIISKLSESSGTDGVFQMLCRMRWESNLPVLSTSVNSAGSILQSPLNQFAIGDSSTN